MTAEKKGWFVYSQTAKGNFNFRLKAPNKETVAVCEGAYADLKSCKAGIDSVRRFCAIEAIEDLSLVKPGPVLKYPKYEVYKDKQGKFRYRLYANNGNLLCISEEGYASKDSCKAGIQSVQRWAPDAVMVSDKEFSGK